MGQEIRSDTLPGVAHGDLEFAADTVEFDSDLAFLGRELHSVGQELPDDLLDPIGIGKYWLRTSGFQKPHRCLSPSEGANRLDGRRSFFDLFLETGSLRAQRLFSRAPLRQIPCDFGESHMIAVVIVDRGNDDVCPEARSIFSQSPPFVFNTTIGKSDLQLAPRL